MLATNPSGNVPYTPSIPLLYGLRESLALLKAEGMDNVVARHNRRGAAFCRLRRGLLHARSLSLFNRGSHCLVTPPAGGTGPCACLHGGSFDEALARRAGEERR
jgi:aspartate aminotransferase-like enzyme